MDHDLFDLLERTSSDNDAAAALDLVVTRLREQKRYQLIFEIRQLQTRHALGLPLVFGGGISDIPPDKRDDYQAALVDAAREAGQSFLADGDIEHAWTYFRAIGEPAPVSDAIERVHSAEDAERVLGIALLDNVNPRKGYELLLEHHGLCQGTDFAIKCAEPEKRVMFLQMLVRAFYRQLAANLRDAIAAEEGAAPATSSVAQLIAGRDWLFDNGQLYIENSHLLSILQVSGDIPDAETLRLVLELAEYGQRLGPIHQFDDEPPFEKPFVDHAEHLRALLGEHVDRAVDHFRRKLSDSDPACAEVLVALLARLGRYHEAVDVSLTYLNGDGTARCPSAIQLCQSAGDYSRLREVARESGDLVGFAAAIIHGSKEPARRLH